MGGSGIPGAASCGGRSLIDESWLSSGFEGVFSVMAVRFQAACLLYARQIGSGQGAGAGTGGRRHLWNESLRMAGRPPATTEFRVRRLGLSASEMRVWNMIGGAERLRAWPRWLVTDGSKSMLSSALARISPRMSYLGRLSGGRRGTEGVLGSFVNAAGERGWMSLVRAAWSARCMDDLFHVNCETGGGKSGEGAKNSVGNWGVGVVGAGVGRDGCAGKEDAKGRVVSRSREKA